MNSIFLPKGIFWLPSLAAVTVLGSGFSAVAETIDSSNSQPDLTSSVSISELETQNQNSSAQMSFNATFSVDQQAELSLLKNNLQFPNIPTQETANRILTPVPGTAVTLSAALAPNSPQPTTEKSTSSPSAAKLAQADIEPSRSTRGAKSYLGAGGNIGLSGASPLGDGNFAVISKIGLTNTFSVRPSVVIGNDTVILAPITYEFSFPQVADPFNEPLPISPYVGAGAAFKTSNNSQFGLLLSAGMDVPLNARFTATAAINAAFFDTTDVGLLLGVGYNFGSY